LNCPYCTAEIPDQSKYCLSCGKEIIPDIEKEAKLEPTPDPSGFGMICFAFSVMLFFFAFMPAIFGFWPGVYAMVGGGVLLLIFRYFLLRGYKKEYEKKKAELEKKREEIMKRREQLLTRVKCRYCGGLNEQRAERCDDCGAPL
jgi:hypothetical protein